MGQNEGVSTLDGKEYYIDKNGHVFNGEKLFIKEEGSDYLFNKNHEIIEKREVFSIYEKDGDKYIDNFDKYDLDYYLVDGKGYIVEKMVKLKNMILKNYLL